MVVPEVNDSDEYPTAHCVFSSDAEEPTGLVESTVPALLYKPMVAAAVL